MRNSVLIGKPYENRKPNDTEPFNQKYVDDIMARHGFKARRGNSIFVTTDFNQASSYGSIYYIFPINGFTYSWNVKVDDWVPDKKDFYFKPYTDFLEDFEYCYDELDTLYSELSNGLIDIRYDRLKTWMIYRNKPDWKLFRRSIKLMGKWIEKSEDLDTVYSPVFLNNGAREILKPLVQLMKKYPGFPQSKLILKTFSNMPVMNQDKYEKAFIKNSGLIHTHLDTAMKVGHEIYTSR